MGMLIMARRVTQLTATEVKQAKPKDKDYDLYDGNGLQLRVRKNANKVWCLIYKHPVSLKRVRMTLGNYPDLSLAIVRKIAAEHRELISQGIDPKEHRQKKQEENIAITVHTLRNVSESWFDKKKKKVTPDHADDIWRSFELHLFPSLGKTPISQISAPMVIKVLRPLEIKGNLETLKRVAQRLNEVMIFSVNTGLVHANPLAGIRAAFDTPSKKNMATIEPAELPDLMSALNQASIKIQTRCLIEWQLHTLARPSEASGTRWDEIDFENNLWVIPAERMKKRKEHRIPLTNQTVAILTIMQKLSSHSIYVFSSASDPKKAMNSQTANMALKRMGYAGKLHAHGLRALASTTLNEQNFESDLIEAALAHIDKNEVRATYNRTDYLERRRPMMHWWSEHIETAAQGTGSLTGRKAIRVVGEG